MDIERIVVLRLVTAGLGRHIDVHSRLEEFRCRIPHFAMHIAEQIVHDEFVGEAIEGNQREEFVAALDEDRATRLDQAVHVLQGNSLMTYMRQHSHREQGVVGPLAPNPGK